MRCVGATFLIEEQNPHMTDRLIVIERPKKQVTFIGIIEIHILTRPAAESQGHPKRGGPGNAWYSCPLGSEVHVSRTVQALTHVSGAAPRILGMFIDDEKELISEGFLVPLGQTPCVRSSTALRR